jgi:hypothetical protein
MITRSKERQAILDAIENAGGPIGPRDIAAAMKAGNVRFLLLKLLQDFAIVRVRYGRYARRTLPFSAQELQLRGNINRSHCSHLRSHFDNPLERKLFPKT